MPHDARLTIDALAFVSPEELFDKDVGQLEAAGRVAGNVWGGRMSSNRFDVGGLGSSRLGISGDILR